MSAVGDAPEDKPKRSSRADSASKGGASSKRGRPRVEPHDESAAERRRTQIRLAQRAYRERKESTIADLEQRVARLQRTVHDMNQTFVQLHDQALASGVVSWRPTFGESLRQTMDRFLELAQDAHGSDADLDPDDPAVAQAGPRKKRRQTQDSPPEAPAMPDPSTEMRPHLGALDQQTSPATMGPPDLIGYGGGYDATAFIGGLQDPYSTQRNVNADVDPTWITLYPPDFPPPQSYPQNDTSQEPRQRQQQATQLAPSREQQQQQQQLDFPRETPNWAANWDPWPALKMPLSYAFNEASFARRLQRDAHERVHVLLTDPGTTPQQLLRKMRYSLAFGSKPGILERVRWILARPSTEPLGLWDWPGLLHKGGAGLHYDPPTEPNPPPVGWRADRNVGPWPLPTSPYGPVDPVHFPHSVAQAVGLHGVWFDCHDVEMYLRNKGVYLTASAAVVEVDVTEPGPGSECATSTATPAGHAAPPSAPAATEALGDLGLRPPTIGAEADPLLSHPMLASPQSPSPESSSSPESPPTTTAEGGVGLSTGIGVSRVTACPSDVVRTLDFRLVPTEGPAKDTGAPATGAAATAAAPTFPDLPLPAMSEASPPLRGPRGSMPNLGPSTRGQPPLTPPLRRRKTVTIDVERLLDALNCSCICLGRSPGYRQEDVDSALNMALRNAW